jgi:serine O-acetyltransferase
LTVSDNELALNEAKGSGISAWGDLKQKWSADLYRYTGRTGKHLYLKALLRNTSYRYTFWLRFCAYLSQNENNIGKKIAFRLVYELFRLFSIGCNVDITYDTKIGAGLYMPHLTGIVISHEAVIGRNCNISQNVTIGDLKRGERKGSPVIGNNVYIAPGAVVVGKIKIGKNAAIGANCVVNKDLPDNAVAVGVPSRVISLKGSLDYIDRIDY